MLSPVTRADLHAARAWRLRGIDHETAQKAAGAIFTLVDVGMGAIPPESAMEAILEGFGVKHGGKVVTMFHALLSIGAESAGAWHGFYPSAYLVFEAYRQANRATGRRHLDALDHRILAYLMEGIDAPAEIWRDLLRHAYNGCDDTIADYDQSCAVLIFQASTTSAELTDIRFDAFRRRVQRLKKPLRQLPASVAPGFDTSITTNNSARRAA